jgi:hypothetical protein
MSSPRHGAHCRESEHCNSVVPHRARGCLQRTIHDRSPYTTLAMSFEALPLADPERERHALSLFRLELARRSTLLAMVMSSCSFQLNATNVNHFR